MYRQRYLPALVLAIGLIVPNVCVLGQEKAAAGGERQLATALEQRGEYADAEAAWRAYAIAHPQEAAAYAHLGFLEAQQQHYIEAISLYQKALALDPAMPRLQMNLGLSQLKSGSPKDAVQTFADLREKQPLLSPERQRLDVLIGMTDYSAGWYDAAIPYLKEATDTDRQSLELRLVLAQSCLGAKQYPCVLDVYHGILLLNAESAEADMLAGEALDEMKDPSGALEEFRAAVKTDPKLPKVHFGLGYLLWKLNRYDAAATEFATELANDPNDNLSQAYLGDTKMRLQDANSAKGLLEKASMSDPSLVLAHLDLGVLYSDAGRYEDALHQLLIARQLAPGDYNVHWRLARVYRAMGKKDEAKAEFDRTRQLQEPEKQTILNELRDAKPGSDLGAKVWPIQ